MSALMKYHGAKWRLSPWIVSLMPEHKCYVEPFGGSAAVLMHKNPVLTEVYNDLNSSIVNVFKQVRENTEELANLLAMTTYSRDELEIAYEETTSKLEMARRFIVRSQLAISTTSLNSKTGFRGHINSKDYASQPSTWSKIPETVYRVRKRLDKVIIENTDAFKLFPRYDMEQTLWFLDPPYPRNTRTQSSNQRGYTEDFTDTEHEKLLDAALKLKGKVMICTYRNELYDTMLSGWHKESKKGFSDGKKDRVETIYMNFTPQKLLF